MKTKFCPMCKMEKPVDEFYSAPSRGDGRDSYCKQCHYAYKRKWEHDNPEKYKETRRRYTKRAREHERKRNVEIKKEVLAYYGGGRLACIRCSFEDVRALSIDHIGGGGAEHRRNLWGIGGVHFYKWLRKRGFPDGYQTLCMNCQFIKRAEGKEYGRPE